MEHRTRRHRSFTLPDLVLLFVMVVVAMLAGMWTHDAHAQALSKPVGIQFTAQNNACVGTGFALQTLTQLVLNGANAGTPQPCGQLVTFANAITVAGTYTVAFKAGNSAGFSAATTSTSTAAAPNPFLVGEPVTPPPLPGTSFTITCGTPPAACTPPITISPGP